jgi:transcriptional regulator with XRE-family HTH domain
MRIGAAMWLERRNYGRVGQALLDAREDKKLTQTDLAIRLRKPQSFVSSYETGQRRVDILEFLAITSAIGADPIKVFAKIVKAGPPPKMRAAKRAG